MLLHRRMNDCRLRIILIRLWYRTALEERSPAEIGSLGGDAPAVFKPARAATGRWIGSVWTPPSSSETVPW